jgi:hypothetical protein
VETLAQEPDALSLALLRREVALEKRIQQLQSENELEFYKPHGKQILFHIAGALYHYRYGRTGNRFGKSEMGAAEDVSYALGYRPWWKQGTTLRSLLPVVDHKGNVLATEAMYTEEQLNLDMRTAGIPNHPTKGVIITTDWDKSTEVFTEVAQGPTKGKLFKYIPKSRYINSEKNHSGAIDTIRVRHISGGVSVIRLDTVKSFKQNPLGSESGDNDWAHFDEPIPHEMYNAIIRGFIDRDGCAWFTCTPLTEPWIDEKFIPDTEQLSKEDLGVVENGDFWMMTGSTNDNPHNTPEAVERVMSQYPEEEQETRRSGIPKAYFGLVYGNEFVWNVHVRGSLRNPVPPVGWSSWDRPPKDFCLRFAIDYHPRKPHHVLFIATSPQEYHYVYAEIFLSCLMVDLVGEIRCTLQLNDPTVPGLIDPLADTPNRVTDITPLEEVLRLGLPVIPATKDPHNGILKVKSLLKQRDRMGNPMLQVNPECRRFLMEISRGYIWDGETNKPVKDKDDAMENFYRLCLQGLHYIEPSENASYIVTKMTNPIDSNIIRPDEFSSAFEDQKPARSTAFASRYRS